MSHIDRIQISFSLDSVKISHIQIILIWIGSDFDDNLVPNNRIKVVPKQLASNRNL
jgi:hypothetical protein